jgi:hypothetical protein
VIDPPGAIDEAARTHMVTVRRWPHVEHGWMPLLTMSKTLSGLGFSARAISPPRKAYGELPPPKAIAVGASVESALEDGDAFLENGSLFHDYAIELAAGQHVTIDLRGGRSVTEACCFLDVFLEIRGDAGLLAHDDDGGGGFDAHLDWTAPAGGRYVVRASTAGSGRKRGPFVLTVK